MGVSMKCHFQNFPTKKKGSHYIINSDQQRYQQVLLNLISNALKFSQNEETIEIFCKLIKNVNDLSNPEKHGHLLKKSQFGMLQIAVQDTGIGIKKEDQNKLFKLFGFLERTKEINSKGIGLGLHICKMIVQQLGGDIDCESIWLEGSTFTFLIALTEMKEQEITVQRYRNPLRKNYPKLKIQIKEEELVFDQVNFNRRISTMMLEAQQ